MSGPKINNPQPFLLLVEQLRRQATRDGHRALLLIHELPTSRYLEFARQLAAPFLPAEDATDRADRVTALLGREFDLLVHELAEPCDLGLLAALAGTIRAGGLLVLVMASRAGARVGVVQTNTGRSTDRFTRRLLHLLSQSEKRHPTKVRMVSAASLEGESIMGRASTTDFSSFAEPRSLSAPIVDQQPNSAAGLFSQYCAAGDIHITPVTAVTPVSRATGFSAVETASLTTAIGRREQDRLLDRANDYLASGEKGCVLIRGRRGRGKSTLLGRLANRLQHQEKQVLLTAAHRSALVCATHRAATLATVSPEAAIQCCADVLLVEEAANLPLHLLRQYLSHWRQIVLCTTLEGYEQAGRALDIRLPELLSESGHEILLLQPEQPWRWRAGDPLEAWIDCLMLANDKKKRHSISCAVAVSPSEWTRTASTPVGTDVRRAAESDDLARGSVQRLNRDDLARDENRLRAVFRLLRDNHYQTRTTDLQHLLDAPDLQIWTLENQSLHAAMILAFEGRIDRSLHEAILCKQRRLPDQLLPQLLAQFTNDAYPLDCRLARVLRIAVAPHRRRRHLGSTLLQQVMGALFQQHPEISGIGASFAGDPINIAFWQANGFTRFHSGFRRNPRTGQRALAYLQTPDEQLGRLLSIAHDLDRDNRCHREHWQPGTNRKLTESGTTAITRLTDLDKNLLQRFAAGHRSLADTAAALSRLLGTYPHLDIELPAKAKRRQHEASLRTTVAKLLQQHLRSST